MKNTFILIFAATTVALGILCVVQWRQLSGQKAEIVSLRSESEQASQQLEELETSQKRAEDQRRELQLLVHDLTGKLGARPQAGAKTDPRIPAVAETVATSEKPTDAKGGLGSLFAKMMEDPETKKLMRDQQRLTLDRLYNPLIKQLALPPDEAAQFKDLLADNMMKGVEKATSLFGSDSSTNHVETINTLADYREYLSAQRIVLDPLERKDAIRQQVERLCMEVGGSTKLDEDLLDEVNQLVEAPTALRGTFDPSHLELPDEVLISVMKKHQRYFPVLDGEGNLLPYFIAVRNGDSKGLDVVRNGNEQVIVVLRVCLVWGGVCGVVRL